MFSASPMAAAMAAGGAEILSAEPIPDQVATVNEHPAPPNGASPDADQSKVQQHGDVGDSEGSEGIEQSKSLELVFIDTGANDYQRLVDDLLANADSTREFEVYLLDASRDGIHQITDILAGYDDVDAVHFVSHGTAGQVKLGNTWLSAYNLDTYAGEIAGWNNSLADGADLLIYGCDFAANQEGRTLSKSLGELCDCDVAASVDDTGHALLGGDWDLEYATGVVEMGVAFSANVQANWLSVLSATPVGGVINVNETPNADEQTTANATPKAIASDANGNFIAVWESDGQDGDKLGIYARRFNSDGSPKEGEFPVNTTTAGDQSDPAVAVNADGAFAVVFQSQDPPLADKQDIYAVLYDDTGAVVKSEFRVNDGYISDDQTDPSVAMRDDGSFIVTWTSKDQDGDREGIFGQIFDGAGNALGGLIQVNNIAPKEQLYSSVATNASGDFIVTWTSKDLASGKLDIYARRFDASGTAQGRQFKVDQFDDEHQQDSDVALADNGSFVVAWISEKQDSNSQGIYARRYDSNANPLGDEFLVNQSTPTLAEGAPSVDLDAAGNFVITWTTDNAEVYAREFDALGDPTTSSDIHVTTLLNDQFGGVVTVSDSGDYVVLFSGEGPGDVDGVFAQRYTVPELPVIDVNGAAPGVDHSAAFVEDGGAVNVVAADATLTDIDSAQLQKLSVIITNPLDGADESLSADTSGTSLMASFADGILTIQGSGATDISEFQTVLRTVQYNNASQAPNTADRIIRFVPQDTSLFSGASVFTTVSIQSLNDAPAVIAPATDSTDEDVPLVFSPSGGNAVTIADDAGLNDVEVTLTTTNGTITITPRLGDEQRINDAQSGDQKAPAVAVASDGRYVVVWHKNNGVDKDDVYARTFNADGTAISGDIIVTNNTAKHQRNADVAIDDNGNFVVVWEHDSENVNDKWDIYARTFDINGNPLGGNEKRINETKLNDQLSPSVALDNDGQFIVAWQSKDGTRDIFIRAYDLNLKELTEGEILVNSTLDDEQINPDIAVKSDGQFVVAWQSKNQDDNGWGIYLKRFDVDYAALDGSDVLVNLSHTNDNQQAPSVAVNYNDQLVVAWQSEKQDDPDNSWGVFAQRFDFATGAAVGTEIAVNTETADDQVAPDVTIGDDGKFVVVWQSHGQEADDSSEGIYLQEFNADGTKLRLEERVNTQTLKDQFAPAVSMRDSSQYVVVWQSEKQDPTNDDGIYAQRFLRPGGLNFTAGDGIADVTTTFTGRIVDINKALEQLVFTPDQDFNGSASLQIDVDDLGNTGTGEAEQGSHTVGITVNAVNDAPGLSVPLSTQQVAENQPFTFEADSSNVPVITDIDADLDKLKVTLTVTNGILTIDTGTGVTITNGANEGASVTFTGTQAEVNDVLDGLIYTPNLAYLGPDTLDVTVDDQGNSGSGGPLVSNGSISINVFDYNIPPINNYPANVITPENTTFTFEGVNKIEVVDNDAASDDQIDVRLSVIHGLLKLSSDPGISITGDWAGGDVELYLNGDKDLVNDALDGLMFMPDTNYAGPADLLIQTNDQGNSGIDGDKSDLDIIGISVTPDPVNDAPTVTGPSIAATDEESPQVFTSATATAIRVNDDADGNPIRVTITAPDGTVSLSNTAGTQFQVNTTTDKHQQDAAVATSVTGDFVVVWESENQDGDGYGIYAQRYEASGLPIDSEFKVNATTHKHQTDPAAAMADDGSFVVTWVSEDQDGNNKGIFAQRYDANGEKLGGEIQVNSYTHKAQQSPDVAMDANGRFVIVWQSDDQDGDDWGIYGQVFDNTGAKVGSEFRANFATAKDQVNPAVAMDADGDFVVTWQSKQPGDDKWDIQVRRFNPDGTAKDAADVTVNSVVDEKQEQPDVAMDAAGNFVVTWQSKDLDYPDGKFGIYHRGFNADGSPVTAQQVLVNTKVANEQQAPSVAMDRSGEYVISWQSRQQDDPTQKDKYGVFAQRYNADGSPRDGEFQVNTTIDGHQQNPAVAIGDNGRFIIVWEGENEDGDDYGIFAQRYKDVSDLTFSIGDGTDDAVMQFEGTIDEINDALDGLAYTPDTDFDFDTDGLTTLQIDVDDLGNTGSGGSQTASHTVDITVNAVNDRPMFTIPGPQTAYEEVPLVFSTANNNLIAVNDVDATTNPIEVRLTSYGGRMTLAGTTGLGFSVGDGSDDVTMTFTGTLSDINAALDGLSYTAPAGFAGAGNIQIFADDLGNSGTGGSGTNNAVVLINVDQDFENDPPQINVPGPQQTGKNQPLRISDLDGNRVTIEDDALDNPIRVQLTVTNGTLTLSNALGTEALVNTETTKEQRFSNIAATPTGEFVVVWQSNNQDGSGEGVYGQRFNADGLKVGPEFRINQFTNNKQDEPVIAIAATGEFAVAWTTNGQDGDEDGVFARKYDAVGNPLGNEFLVNSSTIGNQTAPAIAMDAGGRFVVAWQGDANGKDIFAQRFDENGVAQGPEIVVNTSTGSNQEEPAIAMDAAGNFVVVWEADDGNGKGIFAQRFDAAGHKIGTDEFPVNTLDTNGDQHLAHVAMNASGQFLIVWEGRDANNDGIRGTLYDATGTVVREDFVVNELEADDQRDPSVAINDSGEFVVAWHFDEGGGAKEVHARYFDAAGFPTGGEFSVNSTISGTQESPAAAITGDGTAIVSWTSDNQDGDAEGVYVARFIPEGAVTFHAGTATDDIFVDIEGKLDFINGMLNGMIFTPDGNFTGLATVDINVDDQGNTGTGGPRADSDTLLISVGDYPFLDLDADDSSGADGSDYLAHYLPGGGPIAVLDGDFVLQTPESDLKSVTITLTNRPDGANESLTADTSAFLEIDHSYDPGTGELSITGQDVVANYLSVLATVQYGNTAPTADASDRIITVQFRDKGNDDSNVATTTVLVNKQAPVLDVTGELDYIEADPPTLVVSSANVTDPDTANFAGGKLTIDMASSGTVDDRLAIRNAGTGVGQISIVGLDVQYNFGGGPVTVGSFAAPGPYDGLSTLEINLNANSDAASVAAVTENVTFENLSSSPATNLRAVRFVLEDGEGGISETASATVRVTDLASVPPVLAAIEGSPLSYSEGDAPTVITSTVTASDADDTELEGATIQITGNYVSGQDLLAFADTANISGSWDAGAGTLTLTGTDTLANYEAALRSVTFENTSISPSLLTRTVAFRANDGNALGNAVTRDITVTSINDAPSLASIEGSPLSYTENDDPVKITGLITIADADDANIESAVIQVTAGYVGGEDVLGFSDTPSITGSWDAGTGTLTLTGSDTLTNYEAALRSVTYQNSSENPSTAPRTVSFTADDGDDFSNTQTRDITITPVNDAPVLAGIEGVPLAYTEDEGPVAITSSVSVGDVDDANIESATIGIYSNYVPSEDVLTFVDTPSINGSWDAASGILTLTGSDTVANYEAALRSITYENISDNPNTGPRGIGLLVNDGDVASNKVGRLITITAQNNAPTLAGIEESSLAYTEGNGPVAVSAAIKVNDPDDVNIESATIQITANYASGEDVLAFSDMPSISGSWDAGTGTLALTGSDTIANYQAALRSVTYENTSDAPDTSTRTVSFTVNDGDDSSNTLARNITVTPLNDAPTVTNLAGDSLVYIAGSGPVVVEQGADAAVSDVDSADFDAGNLTVAFAAGSDPVEDVLSVRHQGMGAGQIGFAAGNVYFGGVLIGTASGGSGGADLVVTFNASANAAATTALVQNITFENTNVVSPTIGTRTVRFRVADGDGGVSLNCDTSIDINGDAAPGGVLSNLRLWLKADTGVTTGSGGVSQWVNQVANGTLPDVQQASALQRPDLITSALNYNPLIRFDGVDDDLRDISVLGSDLFSPDAASIFIAGSLNGSGGVILQWENTLNNRVNIEDQLRFDFGDYISDQLTGPSPSSGYHVLNAQAVPGTPAGLSIHVDGALTASGGASVSDPFEDTGTGHFYLGQYPGGGFNDDADLAEVVIYSSDLSAADRLKVDSYLAIKYGMTLDQSVTTNYVSSAGTIIWDAAANTGYDNDIAGIGQDAASDLDQLQSRSINSDAILTVSNPQGQNNGEFLLWGNDDGSLTETAVGNPAGINQRLQRIWRADETGDVGAATFTFDVSSLPVSGTSAADFQLLIDTDTDFTGGTTLVSADSFAGGLVTFNGVDLADGQYFALATDANNAPTLSAIEGARLVYTENDPATAITGTLAVADTDDANIAGATIQLSGNYQNGEDVLAFTDIGPITGSWNAAAGTMTLTGSDTLANYEAALRTVTYRNTSDDPNTSTRTVSITVYDGYALSNVAARDIEVTAANDPSTLSAIEAAPLAYAENDGPAAITSAIVIADVDDSHLEGATIQITGNYASGEDVLAFTDTASITGNWNAVTGTMTLSGTDTIVNYRNALRSVSYENVSDDPGTLVRTVSFTVDDGDDTSNTVSCDINLTASNDAPVLASIEGAPLAYTENDPATAVTSTLTLSDVDDGNIEAATFHITGNYQIGEDLLAFADIGPITGSWNAVTGTMTLSGGDSLANYEAALRTVTYQNTSDNPTTLDRTVSFTVNDGDDSSNTVMRNISITPVNDPSVLVAVEGTPLAYTEDDPATLITSTITISDLDSITIKGATIQITGNYAAGEDLLEFADTASITGSWNAATGAMTLSGSDTLANYNSALRAVTYQNTSDAPSMPIRTVRFTVNDGDDPSNTVTRDITVAAIDDAPKIDDLTGDLLIYASGSGPVVIDQDGDALVSDPDSLNFSTGELRVAIVAGGTPAEDVLAIRSEGSAPGQISITGSSVNYDFGGGPVSIGSFTGGVGGADLVVSLNANATPTAVSALVQNITYENTETATPTTGARTVRFTVDDGDSGTSIGHDATVNLPAGNIAPTVFGLAGDTLNYTEGEPAQVIEQGGNVVIADADSIDFDGGNLTVSIISGGEASEDILGIRDEGTSAGQIGFDGLQVTYGGIAIGTASGGSGGADLVISLNGNATPEAVTALVQKITYVNTDDGDPTTTQRIVRFTVDDGDGGTSANHNARVRVFGANDAPIATDDDYAVNRGQTLTSAVPGVLAGDADADFDPLTVTLVSGTAHGNLTLNPDGSFSYTADTNYLGIDSFTYQVDDGHGGTDTATVTITVNSLPNPPVDPPDVDPPSETGGPPPETGDPPPLTIDPRAVEVRTSASPSIPRRDRHVVALNSTTQPLLASRTLLSQIPTFDSPFAYQRSLSNGRALRDALTPRTVKFLEQFVTPFDVGLLSRDLQEMAEDLSKDMNLSQLMAGSAVGISGALTVGYVLWTIRGGWLLTSLLAQMPAWRMVDPLVVLNYLDGASAGSGNADDEESDDSLESLLDKSAGNQPAGKEEAGTEG